MAKSDQVDRMLELMRRVDRTLLQERASQRAEQDAAERRTERPSRSVLENTSASTRNTQTYANSGGGGGGGPSPRDLEGVPRDPMTQYRPPLDFDVPKRVIGADYTLSWDWGRHVEDGPCECPPGHSLLTTMYNGRKYWVCISECFDPNSTLGSTWNGANPPFCECNEGFYYSQENGCKAIPECPSGLVFDYSIEECIRECGPEQVWNRESQRCECVPDTQGRARIPNASTGECEIIPCNSTYSNACNWDNGNFQAALLSILIYKWLRYPLEYPPTPTVQEDSDRGARPDLRFFEKLYGRMQPPPDIGMPGHWLPPRVSISNRKILSRFDESLSRVEYRVEPAFSQNEIDEIISMYREICYATPYEIKRGYWRICLRKLEFVADPNGPCNCFIKPMCGERQSPEPSPSPSPSADPYEREPEFDYDPF